MKIPDKNIENLFGDLKKENPFKVPENYFETFADRLANRIGTEREADRKRSAFFTLKPFLTMAASFAIVMLLIYVPFRKYFPAEKEFAGINKSVKDSDNSSDAIPGAMISNFSEEQFMSAFSEMEMKEPRNLSPENLADYIAADYSDYEIVANN